MKGLLKIRENKVFKISMKIVRFIAFILLMGFVIVVCMQRFSNNRMSFFNYRMFTVISGSMEPKYNIGDVLISKNVDPSTIRVGDPISYIGTKGDLRDKVITHEVTEVKKDENGKYVFRAKGIKNIVEDPEDVLEEQLLGVVVYRSIILSFLYRIISTSVGFYILIIIPLMYIIGYEIINVMLKKEEKRRMGSL